MKQDDMRHATLLYVMGAALVAACAGGDVPAASSDLERAVATTYGGRTVPSTANAGGSAGAAPSAPGGQAGTSAGGASADDETPVEPSGSGGSSQGTAGEGDGMTPSGGEEEPPSTPGCDGFEILQANCGQGGCHGPSSNLGNFAESETAARAFIGEPGRLSCAGAGVIIDPDDPAGSILIQKVSDDPPCGSYMPPSGGLLSASEVQCLEDWMGSL